MAVPRDQLRHRDAELFKSLGDVGAGLAAAALPKTDVGNVTPQLFGERRPAQLVLLAIGAQRLSERPKGGAAAALAPALPPFQPPLGAAGGQPHGCARAR